jgi:hypothetical protein
MRRRPVRALMRAAVVCRSVAEETRSRVVRTCVRAAQTVPRLLRKSTLRPALVVVTILGLSASIGATLSSALGRREPPHVAIEASVPRETAAELAMSGWLGIAETMREARLDRTVVELPKAPAPPPPAPPQVANEAPLSSHEVFGFVPYWTLAQESSIDVSGFTTLAYFSVDANANGTLAESGSGWNGYESEDFADLVARAHAAGDRVVLTVECFTQPQLTDLTTSSQAAQTLASQVLQAVSSKNLDGVNIDFEGAGNRTGLTSLVTTVSDVLHAANPHYQVTVDTYASAAGTQGFYNVPALASAADGLFVMAYGLNLASGPTAASPITSNEFSDTTAAAEYAAAAPPGKIIFGLPYFGYVWPTDDGTMSAVATGTGAGISDADVLAGGHPVYWDPVTDCAWTSYEVGTQWYEAYFTDPASIFLATQLAEREGFAGVGAWALGMEGDAAQMTAALDGNAPPQRAGPAGPASTSMSKSSGSSAPKTTSTTSPASVTIPTIPTFPRSGVATTTTTTTTPGATSSVPTSSTTTTTTTEPGSTAVDGPGGSTTGGSGGTSTGDSGGSSTGGSDGTSTGDTGGSSTGGSDGSSSTSSPSSTQSTKESSSGPPPTGESETPTRHT